MCVGDDPEACVLPSSGNEESDEVALVAIMNGIELKSRSRAFRGGSMFSWLGGIAVDASLAGGVAIGVPEPERSDAPTLRLDGFSAFGGNPVGAKPAES